MRQRVGAAGCPERINGNVFLARVWLAAIFLLHWLWTPHQPV
jgi:hypothetical protein